MLFLRLRWALGIFLVVLVGGTIGYHYIEGWTWLDAFWMVVITLTTIGYGETHPLSEAGRMFTLVMIVMGVGLSAYTVGQLTRYIVDGELARSIAARRKRRQMQKLEGHFIVVGLGRLGKEVAAELHHRGHQVVAIEITAPHPEEHRFLTMRLEGDGSSDDLLREAAIERAHGVAAATGSDATNIFVTLSARQMNPNVHIITRVDEEASVQKAIRAGANAVINPYGISGARMAQGLVHPHAAQLVDRAVGRAHAEFEIEDIAIGEVADYNGPLGSLGIPERHRVQLVALRRPDGDLVTGLGATTELRPGDIAIVVGRPSDIRGFATAARGRPGVRDS